MKQPTHFEIPDQLREAADRNVEQARKAFEQLLEATHKAVASAEGQAKTVGEGAADVSRQALAFAEENIAASFDLAQNLARVRTVEEATALHQEFLQKRMAAAVEQGQQIGGMVGRTAGTAAGKAKK
jgi:phasin